MMKHLAWEALRDQVALQIYIKECAQMQISYEEAEQRWASMPTYGRLSRRVELRHTAGFALIALEELGYLEEKVPAGRGETPEAESLGVPQQGAVTFIPTSWAMRG
jgi:hypothetical protein